MTQLLYDMDTFTCNIINWSKIDADEQVVYWKYYIVGTPDSSCDSEADGTHLTDASEPDAVVQYDAQCTGADGCELISTVCFHLLNTQATQCP